MSEVRYQDTLVSSRKDKRLANSGDIYHKPTDTSVEERLEDVGKKIDAAIPRISNLEKGQQDEIVNRKEADKLLQASIDAEVESRESGDNSLKTSLDAEVESRSRADTLLQKNVDKEASERKQADDSLKKELDNEAKLREAASNDGKKALEDFKSQFVDLSYEEYEALEAAGKLNPNVYYNVFE